MLPKLLEFIKESEYKNHFEKTYCQKPLMAHGGIPIYFAKSRFEHSFFESSDRRGLKDIFSKTRAERMDWIAITLKSPSATLYQGWNRKKRCYEPNTRVAFEFEEFVVVVRISLKRDGTLKGKFITCYQADNSIEKIKKSPRWNIEKCMENLKR
jgi:hypothetical protein